MNKIFNKYKNKKTYFKGWYIKQANEEMSISFIPAFHIDDKGVKSSSLQIITNSESYNIIFTKEDFEYNDDKFYVKIGDNYFLEKGITIDIDTEELKLKADLTFSDFTALDYDIMGPFKYVPLMQCKHGVISLVHIVNGRAVLNGREIIFNDSMGYIETDSGSSFPNTYLWSQCNFHDQESSCIMLSVAEIPMLLTKFKGCISVIYYKGKEYRLTTYLGARIKEFNKSSTIITQGNMVLSAELLEEYPQDLRAPVNGAMIRTIFESLRCRVRYRFIIDNDVILDFVSDKASYEYSKI